jgi:hypothetical protein
MPLFSLLFIEIFVNFGVEKSYPHVSSIMRGIIEARLGDAVGMNQKVILERDDPRRLSATTGPMYKDICKFWCAEKGDS